MLTTGITEATWSDASRRTWATVTSFAAQAMGLGILLLLPLLYTQGLPQLKMLATSIPVPAGVEPPAPPRERANPARPQSNMMGDRIVEPRSIPTQVLDLNESTAPAPISSNDLRVFGSTGTRSTGIFGSLGNATNFVQPPPRPAPVAHPPRVSAMMQAYLVHRVEPGYPPLAKAAHIQGQVRLQAVISKQGTIENLQVLSGHPLLVMAAVQAVRQWRYRPWC